MYENLPTFFIDFGYNEFGCKQPTVQSAGKGTQDKGYTLTIAISLKVNDGLVLAADSASTILGQDPSGQTQVINVYNNANKVFNLKKGLSLGAITWGAGAIGTSSISTLMKDLRRRFTDKGSDYSDDWLIDPNSYTVEDIAKKVRRFMFDEKYVPAFRTWEGQKPFLGFIVAGYSPGEPMAEEYAIHILGDECEGPVLLRPKDQSGVTWNGEPEAISRLVLGFGTALPEVLHQRLGVPESQVDIATDILQQALAAHLVQPAMPFQDAIDLAEFLVDLSIKFYRFIPGAPPVGGPIEVVGISKHEGFKWIRRKHYFSQELNPKEESWTGQATQWE